MTLARSLARTLFSLSKRDFTVVLHLPPGTHRLKFIVDDRWRVSRQLATATDGDGNLVNYVEIPNVARPGTGGADPDADPDALAGTAQQREDAKHLRAGMASLDLKEEARRLEALRRGELEDVFGDEEGEFARLSFSGAGAGEAWGLDAEARRLFMTLCTPCQLPDEPAPSNGHRRSPPRSSPLKKPKKRSERAWARTLSLTLTRTLPPNLAAPGPRTAPHQPRPCRPHPRSHANWKKSF